MDIKKDSWYVWYYRGFYEIASSDDLTKSFCVFFWKFLVAFICLPLSFPLLIYVLYQRRKGDAFWVLPGGIVCIMTATAGFLGIVFLKKSILAKHLDVSYFTAFYGGGLLFAVVTGIVLYLVFKIIEWRDAYLLKHPKTESKNPTEKTKYIIVEGFKAFIGKYCPRINWK